MLQVRQLTEQKQTIRDKKSTQPDSDTSVSSSCRKNMECIVQNVQRQDRSKDQGSTS